MTGVPRDVRDLLPDDVPEDELARLARVHDLLLAAGPPEELSPRLAAAPAAARGGARVIAFGRNRWKATAAAAVAAAAVLFGIGFASGWSSKGGGFEAVAGPIPMVGGGTTQNAAATIWIGKQDAALNWPSRMQVRGLPQLGEGEYYALWLTEKKTGKRLVLCSAFAVHKGVTEVTFNYPGDGRGKGWVIVAEHADGTGSKPLLWTTRDGSGTRA